MENKIVKILILTLSVMVIILELLAIFNVISFIWGLVAFLIIQLIKYFNKGKNIKNNLLL